MDYIIAIPALIAFVVTLLIGPWGIRILHQLKFGQTIRDEGPKWHQKKSGTPTMGGVLFLIGLLVGSLVFAGRYPKVIPVVLVTFGFGLVGFVDDFIKVVMKRNLGLTPIQKMAGEFVISILFEIYMVRFSGLGTDVIIPFTHGAAVDLGWLYIPILVFVLIGTVNGSNFTDGLDGLASSVTVVIAIFLTVVASANGHDLTPVTSAMIGALLGFLCFNTYPAKVFMGDTGSLAIGGAITTIAIISGNPLIIVIVGGIYVIEALSVIIQVTSFKLTGKRVFKMAPIHHHFEHCGWREVKVVTVFSIITVILCIIGFFAI